MLAEEVARLNRRAADQALELQEVCGLQPVARICIMLLSDPSPGSAGPYSTHCAHPFPVHYVLPVCYI